MISAPTSSAEKRHIGRNVQKIRLYIGLKQEALAINLGISRSLISKIERREEIEESLLEQIAEILGVSMETIRNFDHEKAINNMNRNFRETAIAELSSEKIHDTDYVSGYFNPIEKIVELYERLLYSEREKRAMKDRQ